MSVTFESRADFEQARSTGHTCAPPYINPCRACDLYEQWTEDEGAALEEEYERFLAEHDPEPDLFECRGLASCHALIEWRGVCRSCQSIADDMRADAEREARS